MFQTFTQLKAPHSNTEEKVIIHARIQQKKQVQYVKILF